MQIYSQCIVNIHSNGAKIQPFLVSVVAGQARLNESTDYTQKSAVAAIIVHPEFEYTTLTNDVALIKVIVYNFTTFHFMLKKKIDNNNFITKS